MATRINSSLGRWSDFALYFVGGSVASSLEIILLMVPASIIMAKIIAPGIEGTMFSLTGSILTISFMVMRNLLGVFINRYIGVTKEKMGDYYILLWIELFFKMMPFFYIGRLIKSK